MTAPYVADIKRNSLDDGPGIRSTVFFKGCPLSCVWCHNPECIAAGPELLVRPERCVGARDCLAACPHGAMRAPHQPDRAVCQRSGACAQACPSGALELVGRRWELDALAELLLRDHVLYRSSGGGVTLSGGEPTLYADWVGRLAARLREHGVHVLVETCGHFEWDRFAEHLQPHLDEVYVDLKVLDAEGHRRWCGRDNATILANIERLLGCGLPVTVRVPLVPEITASAENLRGIAGWLRARGVARVALLDYNPLWTAKSTGLARAISYERKKWLDPEEKAAARRAFEGLEVIGS